MALDAGEVYVVVGSKIDSGSFARADAAMKGALASSNNYQKSIDRGEAASKRLGEANQRWAHAAVIGAKSAAIGVAGVVAALSGAAVAAAKFDSSMRNVNSIAGLGEKQFKALEQRVLGLSVAVGKSPDDLAKGLYSIVSSGFKAADAMKILTAGARAARAGLTDTATATSAITSVLNAYNLGAGQARKVSDLLFQTVNVGVLNFEQLAGSLGKVLPSAKGLGVSLKDLLGAEAALTLQGNSADEATTQLGQVMSSLTKPSKGLAKELKSLGFESGQAAIAHLGFKGTMDALGKAAGGNQALLAAWFGNIRAFRGVNGLEGSAHATDLFSRSIKAMNEATKGAGETAKVYAEQQKSTAAQFDHLKAAVDVAAVTIGAALLPQINAGITALTHWFAAAQKSGDLQKWATDIAHGVHEVVAEIEHLAPVAQQAFHVIASTVQAAIPFVQELYHIFQTLEPAIADVAHAAAGLTSAIGPGPILAAGAAFLVFRRATLQGQAAMGTFAKVMSAGEKAIGSAGGGAVLAGGRFNKIGSDAIKSSSGIKILARGIVSSFGPQLLAVGAAGIVASIIYIKSTMTDLKKETQDVVDAIAELQGTRLDVAASKIAQQRAAAGVVVAQKTAGSRAGDVARVFAADPRPAALRAKAPSQAEIGAVTNLAKANLNLRDAINQRERADAVAAAAMGARQDAAAKLAKQLVGQGQKALEQAQKPSFKIAGTGGRYGSDNTSAAGQARAHQKAVDDLVRSLNQATDANNKLDKAGKAVGHSIANFVQQANRIPTKAEYTIIANDKAAGKSNAKIIKDLGWIDRKVAKPTIDADTQPADSKMHTTKLLADNLNNMRPKVHLGATGFDGVQAAISSVQSNILHLTSKPFTVNVQYATGSLPTPKGPPFKKPKAEGGKTSGPEIALIGEGAGPEYVIPTEPRYRSGGIALWMQAGKDLGIPGYKKGTRKPGKTPPPIQRGLGYDPQALINQQSAEKTRLDQAHSYRDTLTGRLKTDHGHLDSLEKQLATAKTQMGSKNKKTAAAASKRASALSAQIKAQQSKIDHEASARRHQVEDVIPRDVKRYEQATRAANIGNDHAKKIGLWNDRADAATSAMTLASDQWDAADRHKDPAGRTKAYGAWDAARKNRIGALDQVKALLQEVKKVVGPTAYGAQITKQLTDTIGSIVQAQDETQAPGYADTVDAGPASTNLQDYLTADELAYEDRVRLDTALASITPDGADDIQAAQEAVHIAREITDRLVAAGAPDVLFAQAVEGIKAANDQLASAVSASTTTSTASVSADQQAQLTQAQAQRDAALASSASDRSALQTYQQSGDLFRGQQSVSVSVTALTAGDPAVQRGIATEVSKALGSQNSVPATTGYYNG